MRDSVKLDNHQPVAIEIYYNPSHTANLARFIAALKDGISYFSKSYGPYEFKQFRLIESSAFFNKASYSDAIVYGENFGWHANFTDPAQFDYCYFSTTFQLCRHWWMYQVAPSHTLGSNNIEGKQVCVFE